MIHSDSVASRKTVDNFYTGAMLEREEVFTNNYKLKGVSMKGRKPARNDQKSNFKRYYENYTIEFGMSNEKCNVISALQTVKVINF